MHLMFQICNMLYTTTLRKMTKYKVKILSSKQILWVVSTLTIRDSVLICSYDDLHWNILGFTNVNDQYNTILGNWKAALVIS